MQSIFLTECLCWKINDNMQRTHRTRKPLNLEQETVLRIQMCHHTDGGGRGHIQILIFNVYSTKKKISHDMCVMKIRTEYMQNECPVVRSRAIACHSPFIRLHYMLISKLTLFSLCSRVTWRLQN